MKDGLLLELDKPMGKGGEEAPPESSGEGDMNDVDAALDDAFEAAERKDKQAFKDAMNAAISAKCAEMYESSPSSEGGK